MAATMRKTNIEIVAILEQIRAQLAELSGRVDRLEGTIAAPELDGTRTEPVKAEAPAAESPAAEPQPEPISEETLAALSACIAAYLGERVHIRQIRVLASPAWAQQGRVSIQASHRLY
jgi:methylmalonyl-CoA carboxyltransferase large subunit